MRLPSGNIWRIFGYTIAAGLALGLLCYGVVRFIDHTFAPSPELGVLLALSIGCVLGLCLFIGCRLALRLAVYDLRHTAAELTGQPVESFTSARSGDELEVLRATMTNALALLPDSQLHSVHAQLPMSAPDLSQRFSEAMTRLAQDLPLQGAALFLYDTERNVFTPALAWNMRLLDEHAVLPADEGAARRVLRERHEVLLSGVEARRVLPTLGIDALDPADEAPSLLCLALLVADAPVGILFLIDTGNNTTWNSLWRELARTVANQLTPLVQEACLIRDLALERARFDTLTNLAIALPENPQLEHALEHTLQAVAETTASEHGTLLLLDKNEEVRYRIALTQGTLAPLQLVARSVLRNGLAGWVLRERRATLISDTQRDSRWLPIPGLGEMRSALAVPLLYNERVLGVLTLAHATPGHYSARALTLVSALTAQITHLLAYAQINEAPDIKLAEVAEPSAAHNGSAHHVAVLAQNEPHVDAVSKELAVPHATQVVVVVLSMRNFTALSERLAPAVLVEDVLVPYTSACVATVQAYGGYLERCDGTLAVAAFGFPQPAPRAAVDALAAAQQLRQTLQGLRTQWRSRLRCDIPIGIGVALDTVTVGQVTSNPRNSFVVVGAAVNHAQRLQELARSGEVLCSAAVVAALREAQVDEATLSILQPLQPLQTRTGDEQPYRLLTQEDRVYDTHRA